MNLHSFLKLARVRAEMLKKHNIDAPSWHMLEAVAIAEHDGQLLCVTELMRLREHGSPATIHRRLVSLRKTGLVLVRADQDDSRIKWLLTSEAAKDLFNEVGSAIEWA